MDLNTGANVHFLGLVVPVGLESNGHAIPPVRVNVSESIAANLDHSLREHMWLHVQVHMVFPRVVKSLSLDGEQAGLIQLAESLCFNERVQHFINYKSIHNFESKPLNALQNSQ